MPRRKDIKKVLVIGSGPIVIGQAAEFDYAGTQACLALKEEGYEVILANSNPATIMTDTHIADKVYMEPLTLEYVAKIIRFERPDAIVPGLGGQTGLNLAVQLAKKGILKECQVEILGTSFESIERAEDRELFKELCESLGEPVLPSHIAMSIEEAVAVAEEIGYPVVLRPAFTLGGTGGGFADDETELREMMRNALSLSPVHQVLVEKSIKGYKEIEYEVMRDRNDTAICICCMENIDPVGIHTGDSIVVAPSQTLTNKEFQMLRDSALKIIRELKIEGGCNVQFALDPLSFKYYLIEVNPRVSRSSALASKASGYPIARVSAKIAVGLTLDEIRIANTPASFEPTLDYIVTKVARFPFDKFSDASNKLGTQMKATGEVMSIGRTMEESLLKAVRSLETGVCHIYHKKFDKWSNDDLLAYIKGGTDDRLYAIGQLIRNGVDLALIYDKTKIDMFFLEKFKNIVEFENVVRAHPMDVETLRAAKRMGFSDKYIGQLWGLSQNEMYRLREKNNVFPVYKMIDTCASEFASYVPYFYSTYEEENESIVSGKEKIIVLGSGPIRIGQGVEFDYSTVHAIWSIRAAGYEAIIINNNPETVSTDFDTGDRLYFDPLNPESVDNIIATEKPDACVVQFGGQTAIKLAKHMDEIGLPILGTPADAIDEAEDRERFDELLERCQIPRPQGTTVFTTEEALDACKTLGYPVLLRPSYVLGGQNMIVAYNSGDVKEYMGVITSHVDMSNPVLVDQYIQGTECEVDAICDGEDFLIPGIMEHIERTGVHSGDSISVYPPQTLSPKVIETLVDYTGRFARELHVTGLVNVQYAVSNGKVYVIEVNPRSSRTVPYISKVTGVPMVDLAVRCCLGEKLVDMGYGTGLHPNAPYVAVKVPVFSFEKLHGVDTQFGPEMKSTGEVLGIAPNFHDALLKGLVAAGYEFKHPGPGSCCIFSVKDSEKAEWVEVAYKLKKMGYKLYGTSGTCHYFNKEMVACNEVRGMSGERPNVIDLLESGLVDYVFSTSAHGRDPRRDSVKMRRKAVELSIPCITAIDTAKVLVNALLGDHSMKNVPLVDISKL